MRNAVEPLVFLQEEAWTALTAAADARFPLETGGILMGLRGVTDSFVVTAVIGPGPAAIHEPTRFAPDYDFQEGQVAEIYLASGGAQTYLGDWHTHPGAGAPHLSGRDREVLRTIAASPQARAPKPVALVLCGSPGDWRPAAWVAELWPLLAWRPLRLRAAQVRMCP